MANSKEQIRDILAQVKRKLVSPEEANRMIAALQSRTSVLPQPPAPMPRLEKASPVAGPDVARPSFAKATFEQEKPPSFIRAANPTPHRAVVFTRPGGIGDIRIEPLAPCDPKPDEVQVLVKAFAMNFGDLLSLKGLYLLTPDYPFTPGFEVSGSVLQVGENVTRFQPGDEVMGLANFGGMGTLVNIREHSLVAKPRNVTHEQACAFPVVFLTMQLAFDMARVRQGEKVLIQTAAGGTGLIAVQMAQKLGAEIFATAGSQEKLNVLSQMGVPHLIQYRQDNFAQKVLSMTNQYGVDVVFNTLSGDAIQQGLNILAPGGRYVEIAMTGLKSAKNLSLGHLLENQIFFSVNLRAHLKDPSRSVRCLEHMAATLAQGEIKPTLAKVFDFHNIGQAFSYMETRQNIGKIVVRTPEITLPMPTSPAPVQATRFGDIAIVGMSGRFPGAADLEEFWDNLKAGRSAITEVPKSRWDIDAHYDPDPSKLNKTHCRVGGFCKDIDQFDPVFFNMSGKEAELTDPQQRIFLEESWKALEDAGYATADIDKAACGIYVGVGPSDYLDQMIANGGYREPQSFWGNEASVLTSRLSYFLNLKGPSVAVNTACSSSLVAIHLACRSLLDGEVTMALAGGVYIRLDPHFLIMGSNAGMTSPDGKCYTFDHRANGVATGEGAGVIVLKNLQDALRDGDHIYGVIKGSATNQDGRTNGITAPSTLSQTDLELTVYKKAGINPASITMVEAHGTGTKLGDPIEIEALTNAFRNYTDEKRFCAIGSVKTNIGHAVAAAGVASVIKVLLSLKHRAIPASLNFEQPNELIPFDESPFFVNTSYRDWRPGAGSPRRAAVSSFGFSGTNVHMVIEEAPQSPSPQPAPRPGYFFPLSARTPAALQQRIADLKQWLMEEGKRHPLGNIAFTLLQGRWHFPYRAAFTASTHAELIQGLTAIESQGVGADSRIQRSRQSGEDTESVRIGNECLRRLTDRNLAASAYMEVLDALCDHYKVGTPLLWTTLYRGDLYRRLSLPTYPFQKKRYWFPILESKETVHQTFSHPLIDALDPEASFLQHGLVFRKTLNSSHPVVSHHQVNGIPMLPATAYLEMARAAIAQVMPTAQFRLSNIVFLKPLALASETVDVSTVLVRDKETTRFQVASNAKGQAQVHAKGSFENLSVLADSQAHLNIEEIRGRCRLVDEPEEDRYSRIQSLGLTYGDSFKSLKQLWQGENEALGSLAFSGTDADLTAFTLHPGLLDAALQTMDGLPDPGEAGKQYLPFSIAAVEGLKPLPRNGYAHVTKSDVPLHFNITVTDEDGRIAVRILNLAVREQKNLFDHFFHAPVWEAQPLPERIGQPKNTGTQAILIVAHAGVKAFADALTLAHAGDTTTVFWLGQETKQAGPDEWELDAGDPSSWHSLLSRLDQLEKVYFLGGMQCEEITYDEGTSWRDQQERSLWAMFRLVKALGHRGFTAKPLAMKIVLNDACELHSGATINPGAGGLIGFAKSLAREYGQWQVSCLDVGAEIEQPKAGLIQQVLAEPGHATADLMALRYGTRYRSVLVPQTLPKPSDLPYRKGGVYLILGGCGGIGLALSRYLAETVRARLVLIGRRPMNAALKAELERIEALGGQCLYLSADASDPLAMSQAIDRVHTAYGPIHGAFHSAIVLADRTLDQMDEHLFRAALNPKIDGSVAMWQALKNEPLDFLCFFSSSQSFIGNAGQSNYAAACTFKDAFAHYLRSQVSYPVKIVNWGYWGEVGIVSSDEHYRRLTALGGQSIRTSEGMEALNRLLASGANQTLPLKAKRHLLEWMGVDFTRRLRVLPSDSPSSLSKAICPEAQPKFDPETLSYLLKGFERLDRLGALMVLDTFQKLGCSTPEGGLFQAESLIAEMGIAPKHRRLFQALLDMLVRHGYGLKEGETFRLLQGQEPAFGVEGSPGREQAKQDFLADFPDLEPFANLLWPCTEHLAAILTGERQATDVLFPGGSTALVEGIYRANPLADYFNGLVAWGLVALLRERVSQLKAGETIHILEVGAGTGGTSALVFEAIRPFAEHLRYTYTDISPHFIHQAKDRFAASSPFVSFSLLNLEKPVMAQGYRPGSYDVVIASNVVHATQNISRSLHSLHELLKAKGCLVLNEVTRARDFGTLTFGLLDGWWLFEDPENRLAHSPLLDKERMAFQLKMQGFPQTAILKLENPAGGEVGSNIFMAEADGILQVPAEAEATSPSAKPQAPSPSPQNLGPKPTIAKAAGQAVGDSDHAGQDLKDEEVLQAFVENIIVTSLAEGLRLDKDAFDRETPFLDFGIDSLLAVDIVNNLNKIPGIELKSTDLFNYTTIHELTEHIVSTAGPELLAHVRPTPATQPPQVVPVQSQARVLEDTPVLAKPQEPEPVTQPQPSPILQVTAPKTRTTDIAIIGMSGRFPDAENVREFWRNLVTGRDSVREIKRWPLDQFYDPKQGTPQRSYCKWGGHLDNIDRFDPLFFKISPREAELMDPQHRLFLEETWKALEDAGYSGSGLAGKKCSVFVGTTAGDYNFCLEKQGLRREAYAFTGNAASILAARIAYFLNLKGPCIPVETACSSSLVALHLACEGLRAGDTEFAIAGGVAITNTPEFYIMASQTGMLSPHGRCKAFAQDADGFVPSEGVGAVILKTLDAALRDGDHIYGVISGSAINQDGKSNGITSPNGPSQTALECEVYDRFDIDPNKVSYVETHGTGTKLGDPIEMDALTLAFRKYTDRKRFCPIGSVKSNIGHALTASGMAGLIKVLLCLKYKKLVPTLHVREENEHIDFANSPFYVNAALKPWKVPPDVPRLALLSSFGFSGTNAHLAIQEAPQHQDSPDQKPGYLVSLSAKTKAALGQKLQDLLDWAERKGTGQSIRHIAFTLHLGRAHFGARAALVVRNMAELIEKLRAIKAEGEAPECVLNPSDFPAKDPRENKRQGESLLSSLATERADTKAYASNLLALANLYVAGCDLDWARLYQGETHRRVPLPTYPFAQEHYPLPTANHISQPTDTNRLHPLVGRNTSTFQQQSYSSVFSGEEFFLSDHVLHGKRVLPGVAYLEMVRAAASLANQSPVTRIRDLVWLRPAIADGHPLELHLSFHHDDGGVAFLVQGQMPDGTAVNHAEGRVGFQDEEPLQIPSALDLNALSSQLPHTLDGADCYARYRAESIDYGPAFQTIQSLRFSQEACLAQLALNEGTHDEAEPFLLHPTLLDGALQSLIVLAGEAASNLAYLPFGVESVAIFGPCPSPCVAYATRKPHAPDQLLRFDILITDEHGHVRIKLENIAMKAIPTKHLKTGPVDTGQITHGQTHPLAEIAQRLAAGTLTAAEAEKLLGDA